MSIQALREQRASIGATLKAHVAKPDWNAAVDQPIYDKAMDDVAEIDLRIKNIETFNASVAREAMDGSLIEAGHRAAVDHGNVGAGIYAKWLRGGDAALSAEDHATIRNTMSTTTGSQGGFTVQTEVARVILDALKVYGGMRAVSTIIQTTGIGDIAYPTSNGTAEVGEIIAQNTTATSLDLTVGTIPLTAYKYSSKVVAVPYELLQDSNVDVEAFVRQRLVTRLGRITNTHFTVGTGTAQPTGVMVAAGVGLTGATGQATSITYDSLVGLIHSVEPAYRTMGNCNFMMADSSVLVLRKVKDGQSRPLFVPGYEVGVPGGAPDRLLGYPIVVNQDVAAMASNAVSVAFGDFSFYTIRDVMAAEMFRFTDSAYTKLGQVGFLAWMRAGGNFIDVGGAVKTFANSAT
jgi:HK97 family phage major capsid protein